MVSSGKDLPSPSREKSRSRSRPSKSKTNVYVYPIPRSFNEKDISEMFDRFGKIMNITILKRKGTVRVPCFVSFAHHKSAIEAIEKYHKADLRDVFQGFDCHVGEKFIVRFADRRKKVSLNRKSGRSPNVKREPLPPNVNSDHRANEHGVKEDRQRNLYVYPLPRRGFDERDLERMFKKYGPILKCNILDRSCGKEGFPAFVDFKYHKSCVDAIRRLNGVQIRDIFDQYEGTGENSLVVQFAQRDNNKRRSHINDYVKNGASKTSMMDKAPAKTKLYVCPLPRTITEREFEDVFSVFGEVVNVHIMHRKTRVGSSKEGIPGFVYFSRTSDAESAVQEYHGAPAKEIFDSFRGSDRLVVRFTNEKQQEGRNSDSLKSSRTRRSPSPHYSRRKRRRGNSWSPDRGNDHSYNEVDFPNDHRRRYDRSDHYRADSPVRRVRRAPAVEKRVVVSLDKHGLEMRRYELERKEYELLAELTNIRKEMIELEGAREKGRRK